MGATVTAVSGYQPDYPRMQASAESQRSPLGYYAAFVFDPDGNNMEAVFRAEPYRGIPR